MSQGRPAKCTGTTTFVLGLSFSDCSKAAASRFIVSEFTSEKATFAPTYKPAFAEETNVIGEVIKASPFFRPTAKEAKM